MFGSPCRLDFGHSHATGKVDKFADAWSFRAMFGRLIRRNRAARRLNLSWPCLLGAVRTYDTVGRYGGEEFLIVVPSADALGVVAQAKRIRSAFDNRSFAVEALRVDVKLSTGVAVADVSASPNSAGLLRAADAALYRAKNAGRNRIELATPSELNGNFPAPAWRPAPQLLPGAWRIHAHPAN
jgi:hypothetical protein